jgi:hypothetical protein
MGAAANARPVKIVTGTVAADGTIELDNGSLAMDGMLALPFAVAAAALTVKGEGGTPTTWTFPVYPRQGNDARVHGNPWSVATLVEHTNVTGVGVTTSNNTGATDVVTALFMNPSVADMGTADNLRFELVILGH